jgi:hypothetical protein
MEGMSFTEYVEMVMVADATGDRRETGERVLPPRPVSITVPIMEPVPDSMDEIFCDDAAFF